jgi:outer membrane autotransporter protein
VLWVESDAVLGAAGTGVTLVDNGVLRASTFTSARTVSLQGAGGVISVDPNQTLTLSGIISGTNLTKNDQGTLILTGTNTYTGNLSINGGAVQGNTGSLSGDIRLGAGASVIFAQSNGGTYSRNISGSGGVTKTGLGALILTGNNNYTGGTTVSNGILQGTSNSLRGNILNNAFLGFDQDFDGAYAGIISGSGDLSKSGAGKLSLSGTHTYQGATDIFAGNLNVNGSLKSSSLVTVYAGATLSGNCECGDVIVEDGGTISPGNSIGVININGNYTTKPGSNYRVEINGAASDRINVTGTASIQSSTMTITHDTDPSAAPVLPGKTYTILTTGGGLTGSGNPIEGIGDFPFMNFALTSDNFNAYLTTSRADTAFADLAATPNEKAAARALDAMGAGNALWQQVVGATEAVARAAFTSLASAEVIASAQTALVQGSFFTQDAALGRLREMMDGAGGADSVAGGDEKVLVASASNRGLPAPALKREGITGWARAFGSWASVKGGGNAAKFSGSTGGVFFGGDVAVSNKARLGVMAGYSNTSFHARSRGASGQSDNLTLGVYGGARWGDLALRAGAAYTRHDLSTRRSVAFPGFNDRLKGDTHASTAQVFGELGYGLQAGAVRVEPFVNLAYVHLHTNGFTEKGGAAAVSSQGANTGTAFSTLGLHASTGLDLNGVKAAARGTLGWRHALGGATPRAKLAFAGGDTFTMAGVPIAKNAAVLDTGLDFAVGKNTTLGVSYNGQFGSGVKDNGVRANLSIRF